MDGTTNRYGWTTDPAPTNVRRRYKRFANSLLTAVRTQDHEQFTVHQLLRDSGRRRHEKFAIEQLVAGPESHHELAHVGRLPVTAGFAAMAISLAIREVVGNSGCGTHDGRALLACVRLSELCHRIRSRISSIIIRRLDWASGPEQVAAPL